MNYGELFVRTEKEMLTFRGSLLANKGQPNLSRSCGSILTYSKTTIYVYLNCYLHTRERRMISWREHFDYSNARIRMQIWRLIICLRILSTIKWRQSWRMRGYQIFALMQEVAAFWRKQLSDDFRSLRWCHSTRNHKKKHIGAGINIFSDSKWENLDTLRESNWTN